MYKTKLCLGTYFDTPVEEQIALFKQAGFDGFFTPWDENVEKYRKCADEIGMLYHAVHAPIGNSAKMWEDSEESKSAVQELLQCVKDCARANVPILILHTYIGFESGIGTTRNGIENFRCVVEAAAERQVKIAFENTEGEEYLAALMDTFVDYENVGFCWDTGHELCYNRGKDMMALYGNRLVITHLNDNLGVHDFDVRITWKDDLHLLPFDGIGDWDNVDFVIF